MKSKQANTKMLYFWANIYTIQCMWQGISLKSKRNKP